MHFVLKRCLIVWQMIKKSKKKNSSNQSFSKWIKCCATIIKSFSFTQFKHCSFGLTLITPISNWLLNVFCSFVSHIYMMHGAGCMFNVQLWKCSNEELFIFQFPIVIACIFNVDDEKFLFGDLY